MMMAFISAGLSACNNDDDEDGSSDLGEVSSEIVGTWYGSAKRAYMTITFKSNGTGNASRTVEYSSGDMMSHNEYAFNWGRKGNKVLVSGYRASIDDEGNEDEGSYSHEFHYDGETLTIESGKYGAITTFTK